MSAATQAMIGRAPAFMQALDLVERMARFDAPVLIQGETGTGKELAARAIHYGSSRRDHPFVPLNCGAVPEALIESELYGCERGAYTDARQPRSGLVAAAEGGSLFLDELDSLPLRAQVSLLRFLQDRSYRTVGGTHERRGNVRIIAAASPRLGQLLATGAFRDDLAFRLNVLQLEMPPLRDRPGDAQLLAEHFIARHARHHNMAARWLDDDSTEWIARYSWPGNVRELDNLVQRALLLSDGETLSLRPQAPRSRDVSPRAVPAGMLQACEAAARTQEDELRAYHEARERAMAAFERQYLERLMLAAGGNVTHAARLAGKERRSLGKLLKKHGMDRGSSIA